MKGQAVADFIAELTEREDLAIEAEEEVNETDGFVVTHKETAQNSQWNLFVNGSSCAKASGAGIILTGPGGLELEYALKFNFKASNNVAEYEALIAGLLMAADSGATDVNIFSDSQLVVNQVRGEFQAKESQLFEDVVGMVQILQY